MWSSEKENEMAGVKNSARNIAEIFGNYYIIQSDNMSVNGS